MFRVFDLALVLAASLGVLREKEPNSLLACEKKQASSGPLVDDQILSLLGLDAIKNLETPELSFHQLLISEILFRVTVHSSLAASVFLGVERMPVHLSVVSLKSTCSSADKLVRDIAGGYLADVLVRTPVLLGSLSLLGLSPFT